MRSSIFSALAWCIVGIVAFVVALSALLTAAGAADPAWSAKAFLTDWRVWLTASVALACGLVWVRIVAGSLAHRIDVLKQYSDRILDDPPADPQLFRADDELGVLGRSMSRVPPRVRELVQRVSIEAQRREAILAGMVEALLAVDEDLKVVLCNDAFARVAGLPSGIAPGTPLVRIVRDPALVDLLRHVLATGGPARRRLQLGSSEGPWFEVNVAPLAMPAGRGAIALLHDITELERLERIRKDFVANVSHELRTPLTAIRGYAETLLDGALDDAENRRPFVEVIETHAIRLNNIAEDLLALSELDNATMAEPPRRVLLQAAVESAIRTVEPAAAERRVHLLTGAFGDLEILGYRMRLEQALVNLIDNAVKFNRPEGEVRIEAERTDNGCARIVVSDTGIGIPSSDLPRVFERFYRVDRARSREMGGTGLGLSIVKHAVEQMKGTVAVESELGKGSRFIIVLPAHVAA
ncbi:MAG: ATP-binding protein [Bryobacteraceae bacterium]|jgi:two-component system phosphate regulon sensor histidine kinase PhoR